MVLNGGVDVAMVPMQIHYDPAFLSLVNVSAGDSLNRDGQPYSAVHQDDGKGDLRVAGCARRRRRE